MLCLLIDVFATATFFDKYTFWCGIVTFGFEWHGDRSHLPICFTLQIRHFFQRPLQKMSLMPVNFLHKVFFFHIEIFLVHHPFNSLLYSFGLFPERKTTKREKSSTSKRIHETMLFIESFRTLNKAHVRNRN